MTDTTGPATLAEHEDDTDALPVRLWLRLLATVGLIEARLRQRLQRRFGMTLPRFDALAQLDRAPEGMTLSRLSDRMMVTKGNITGIVERLVEDGLVERLRAPGDRRASIIRLTARGRARFAEMAPHMQDWVRELLSGMSPVEQERLHALVGRLKAGIGTAGGPDRYPPPPAEKAGKD